MFNVQCSIFLLVSESTPFLALPRKHLPRAQVTFVAQAGRKFRQFSLTLQRYDFFIAVCESFREKIMEKWSRMSCVTSVIKQSGMKTAHNIYKL